MEGLRNQNAMVKCLGTFEWKEPADKKGESSEGSDLPGPSMVTTHNILYEYGEVDLDEYFVQNHPPLLAQEILNFWETLYAVAGAIEAIHDLRTTTGRGTFKGYIPVFCKSVPWVTLI